MAVTSSPDALHTPGRPRIQATRTVHTGPCFAVGGLLWLVAFAVRAWSVRTANDLFIDELTYTRLSIAVGRGQAPNLDSVPFFLHPPVDFTLNALVLKVFGLSGSVMDLVYHLRWVNVVLGACVVLLVFLVARQISSNRAAAVAALVVALPSGARKVETAVKKKPPVRRGFFFVESRVPELGCGQVSIFIHPPIHQGCYRHSHGESEWRWGSEAGEHPAPRQSASSSCVGREGSGHGRAARARRLGEDREAG
jgi:dolichyl-phosphate-mannose--protein O-mannosyl transferase